MIRKPICLLLCYHISGGTCELLYINDKSSEVIGGSLDISFGQLIDRVGVALGYSFPCGKIMDKKALDEENIDEIKPVKMKDSYFNLSGTETKLMNILKDYTEEEISGAVFHAVSKCIYASATAGLAKIGKKMPVALVGNVEHGLIHIKPFDCFRIFYGLCRSQHCRQSHNYSYRH